MEIILSKQAIKKLKIIKSWDLSHAKLIKEKIQLISQKKVQFVQLQWYQWFYKERVWKYRIIFSYKENYVYILILERRDLVYKLVSHLL